MVESWPDLPLHIRTGILVLVDAAQRGGRGLQRQGGASRSILPPEFAVLRAVSKVAVFAGMLGVTLFGIFLTPVFYYVIRRFDS